MPSNIYSYTSSPSPYRNPPIRQHSRQTTMSSLYNTPGASSPLRTSTAPSSFYSSFSTPRNSPPPTPPPRAHRARAPTISSSFHSYDSKEPILYHPRHEPSRFYNLAARLLESSHTVTRYQSSKEENGGKDLEKAAYAAALISSNEAFLQLQHERQRDEEKRLRRHRYTPPTSSPPPGKGSGVMCYLPLTLALTGLLSLFIVLVLILSHDPVVMRKGEIVWLSGSVVLMLGGGGWWVAGKACPRARAARRERDAREARTKLSQRCSLGHLEDGNRERGEGMGVVDRARICGDEHEDEEGVRGGMGSLNRVASPVSPFQAQRVERMERQSEGQGDWRQELASREDRPFVKADRGSVCREEFEMGSWRGIGVAI